MIDKIGVPTFSGIKESMLAYAVGLGGGVLYSLAARLLGSGLIGGLLGAGVAGAAVKGVKGEIISTVLGFQTIVSSMGTASNSTATSQRAIM